MHYKGIQLQVNRYSIFISSIEFTSKSDKASKAKSRSTNKSDKANKAKSKS